MKNQISLENKLFKTVLISVVEIPDNDEYISHVRVARSPEPQFFGRRRHRHFGGGGGPFGGGGGGGPYGGGGAASQSQAQATSSSFNFQGVYLILLRQN